MKYISTLLIFLIMSIIFIAIGNNNQIISLNYFINKGNYALSKILITIFIIGFFLGCSICHLLYAKTLILLLNSRKKIKKLKNKIFYLTKKNS